MHRALLILQKGYHGRPRSREASTVLPAIFSLSNASSRLSATNCSGTTSGRRPYFSNSSPVALPITAIRQAAQTAGVPARGKKMLEKYRNGVLGCKDYPAVCVDPLNGSAKGCHIIELRESQGRAAQ